VRSVFTKPFLDSRQISFDIAVRNVEFIEQKVLKCSIFVTNRSPNATAGRTNVADNATIASKVAMNVTKIAMNVTKIAINATEVAINVTNGQTNSSNAKTNLTNAKTVCGGVACNPQDGSYYGVFGRIFSQ